VNTVLVLGRMLLALVVVLGLMWALARWVRKPITGRTDGALSVLARQQISRTASVTVLQLMDRALVLGVTEHDVRLITETDLVPLQATLARHGPVRRRRARSGRDAAPTTDRDDDGRPAGGVTGPPVAAGPLDGSILSPTTWKQIVDVARERTVRR
jgi:flagellar protein FliO/FliZ